MVVSTPHIPYSPYSLRMGAKLFLGHWERFLFGDLSSLHERPTESPPNPNRSIGFADIQPLEPSQDPDRARVVLVMGECSDSVAL